MAPFDVQESAAIPGTASQQGRAMPPNRVGQVEDLPERASELPRGDPDVVGQLAVARVTWLTVGGRPVPGAPAGATASSSPMKKAPPRGGALALKASKAGSS